MTSSSSSADCVQVNKESEETQQSPFYQRKITIILCVSSGIAWHRIARRIEERTKLNGGWVWYIRRIEEEEDIETKGTGSTDGCLDVRERVKRGKKGKREKSRPSLFIAFVSFSISIQFLAIMKSQLNSAQLRHVFLFPPSVRPCPIICTTAVQIYRLAIDWFSRRGELAGDFASSCIRVVVLEIDTNPG